MQREQAFDVACPTLRRPRVDVRRELESIPTLPAVELCGWTTCVGGLDFIGPIEAAGGHANRGAGPHDGGNSQEVRASPIGRISFRSERRSALIRNEIHKLRSVAGAETDW